VKKSRVAILVVGALIAGLTLGGIGIASAASRAAQTTDASYYDGAMVGATSPVATLSALTGRTAQEILALRAQGKSLSVIATENGVDPAAVVDQTVAARQAYLDTLVTAGKLTAEQEQALLDRIRAAVQAMMDALPHAGRPSVVPTTTPSVPATGTMGPGHHAESQHMNAAAHAGSMMQGTVAHHAASAPHHMTSTAPAQNTPGTGTTAHHDTMMVGTSSGHAAPSGSTGGMMGGSGAMGGAHH
jgi:hypothetical protein